MTPFLGPFARFPTQTDTSGGQKTTPKMGPPKTENQVLLTWRWARWLATRPGPTPLFVNLDETGVPMFMGDVRGNVTQRAGSREAPRKDVTQNVTRHLLRAQVTHVAIICDDDAVQPLLPQVLIGDKSTLTVGLQRELQAHAPPNVTVWRLPSRWVDLTVMQSIIRALAATLRAVSPDRRVILLLDCCPAHLRPELFRTANSVGVYILLVPAKFTWLLQPLDTHVFHSYKQRLRAHYAQLRQSTDAGVVSNGAWWKCLVEHARDFLQGRSWKFAFEATGYIAGGAGVSSYIRKQLEWTRVPDIVPQLPMEDELHCVLPRGRNACAGDVLRNSARAMRMPVAVIAAETGAAISELEGAGIPAQAPWRIPRGRRLAPPPLPPPLEPPSPSWPPDAIATPSVTQRPSRRPAATLSPPPERTLMTTTSRPTSSSDGPISRRTRSRSFAEGRDL